jgi:hypothetical protein
MKIADQIVKEMAEDLAEVMQKSKDAYRLTHPTGQGISDGNLLDGLDSLINDISSKSTMLQTEKVILKTYEYWNDIIYAKIETIAIVGGFDLMQRVHSALEDVKDTGNYNFPAMFDNKADGIGGWWK